MPHHIKPAYYEMLHRALDTWMDSFEQPKWKMDMRFGTWSIRSLYRSGFFENSIKRINKI
jgi:hypothetical protein